MIQQWHPGFIVVSHRFFNVFFSLSLLSRYVISFNNVSTSFSQFAASSFCLSSSQPCRLLGISIFHAQEKSLFLFPPSFPKDKCLSQLKRDLLRHTCVFQIFSVRYCYVNKTVRFLIFLGGFMQEGMLVLCYFILFTSTHLLMHTHLRSYTHILTHTHSPFFCHNLTPYLSLLSPDFLLFYISHFSMCGHPFLFHVS